MLKNKELNAFIRMTILFAGIFASIFIVFSYKTELKYLSVVPLLYAILIMVFPEFTRNMFDRIGLMALNICMFIRYIVSPFLISFYGANYAKSMLPSVESYNLGITLMLYEMVIVFIVFQLLHQKFYSENKKHPNDIQENKN